MLSRVSTTFSNPRVPYKMATAPSPPPDNKRAIGRRITMDIRSIRLRNLQQLIKETGVTLAVFAEMTETSADYLSQIRSEKSRAAVGNELARKIEQRLGKPHGWMDVDQTVSAQLVPFAAVKVIFTLPAVKNVWNTAQRREQDTKAMSEGTYCIRIRGDGYAPAIHAGCGLILSPLGFPSAGDWVYIEREDKHCAIARLIQFTGGDLHLIGLTGTEMFSVPLEETLICHRIIAMLPPNEVPAATPERSPTG